MRALITGLGVGISVGAAFLAGAPPETVGRVALGAISLLGVTVALVSLVSWLVEMDLDR